MARLYEQGRHEEVRRAVREATPDGRYLHWDDLRHREPPEGLTREEWWAGIKLRRAPLYRPLPLQAADGSEFVLANNLLLDEALACIDDEALGPDAIARRRLTPADRTNALMEEAVHSAWMEGAVLGRAEAKDMLRGGVAPSSGDEARIQDTYEGLLVLDELIAEPLSPDVLLELHYVLTSRTLGASSAGRLRRASETPRVYTLRARPLITPPSATELSERIAALCRFANGNTPDWWVHPVLRAAVLHLWVCYEHPFLDGNGLVARALGLWSLRRAGYELAAYAPLSRILRRDPARQERAVQHATTDDNDATYVVLPYLQALIGAIDELGAWQRRRAHLGEQLVEIVHGDLNERQLGALQWLLAQHGAVTIQEYADRYAVSYGTARRDLQRLVAGDLVRRTFTDRHLEYRPTDQLRDATRS